MKYIIIIIIYVSTSLLSACNNSPRQQAKQTANTITDAIETFGPGKVNTTETGYFMKAVIDGKNWTAKSMMEINQSNKDYIYGDDGTTQISFYLDRDHINVGKVRKFHTGHSADLALDDNLMSANSGEWVVTKATEKMIEGSFHFSASSAITGKKAKVTNGSFRIMLKYKNSE